MNPVPCDKIHEQAARLEQILPDILRHLFPLKPEQPASDLPVGQLRVCSILQEGPLALTAIGERLGVSSSAVTQLADRLERAGHVARATEADDRRVRLLVLTDQGRQMMTVRREHRRRRAAQALSLMDEAQRDALLGSLAELAEAAHSTNDVCPAEMEDRQTAL